MTWRSASGVGATALCALLVAGPAAALDIKVWPLFRYARTPDGSVRWSALGPLLEYRRTPDATDLWLRPLLSVHRQRAPERAGEAHILFPLATVRWRDDSRSARFLLFTWRSEPHERRFSLFPLVYWRSDAEGRRLAVLPFYLDLPDFLGYERVTAVLFPAWVRLREPGVERTFYGFPFVSTVGGALGRGFRVWPFFGTKEIVGRERTRYVLWPFHIRREELVPGYGWDRIRVNFPVFAARDGEGIRSRGWGMLAYTSTVDERRGYEAYGSPWPFVVRERPLGAESWRTWRAAPIYGRTDTEGYHARFYGWPGYRWRHESSADVDNERQDFLWFLWRHQRRWAAGGSTDALDTLFPLYRRRIVNGRDAGQMPALADSIIPVNPGVLGLWAPLWGVLRWDTGADGSRDWNLLWGLLARERGRLVGPLHLDPRTDDGDRRDDG